MSLPDSKVLDLIDSSPLGGALLKDPMEFMQTYPENVLIHQSRDARIPLERRLELQKELVARDTFTQRKRFALRLSETSMGAVCVKLRPQGGLGELFGPKYARNEHRRHLDVERRGFAATRPLGHTKIVDGQGLRWQCFVQKALSDADTSGESILALSLKERLPLVAQELAKLHQADIFHGDLKPYHVVIREQSPHWLYVDLDPARIGLTSRRRTTNLYQALRYFLDAQASLAEPLVHHYVKGLSGFSSTAVPRQVARLIKVFEYKLENHSGPELNT